MSRISALLLSFAWFVIATTATAHAGTTLDKIKAAGSLPCGINTEEPEYSTQDAHGNHSAFDLDICKAVAVAVLGPDAKFTVVPYRDEQDALESPQVRRNRAARHRISESHQYSQRGLWLCAACLL